MITVVALNFFSGLSVAIVILSMYLLKTIVLFCPVVEVQDVGILYRDFSIYLLRRSLCQDTPNLNSGRGCVFQKQQYVSHIFIGNL